MSSYALDKSNAKLFGVCSGFARWTSTDPFLVRLGLVLLTLFALGPVTLPIYLLTAWLANAR